jgi:acetyl/propionyl-CoA carboxylase alpha subunit
VTGLDLVEAQLRVAEGEPLPAEVTGATLTGHAVEARLYAEDVPAGFLPRTGTLHRFDVPAGAGVRVDAGYADGGVVGPHYDAMLAKVIAHGRTRAEAIRRLDRALAGARLHGVTTNRDLLLGILREPEFRAGQTDTGYLTRHDPAVLGGGPPPAVTAVHSAVAALAGQAANRESARVLRTLPSGWRNVPAAPNRVTFTAGEDYTVAYRLHAGQPDISTVEMSTVEVSTVDITVNGEPLGRDVSVVRAAADAVDLEVDGLRRGYRVHRVAAAGSTEVYVDGPDGSTALTERPRFADPATGPRGGSLLAPMPGVIVRVLATPGATVTAGQPLVVLEAMKMEHTVAAPSDGVLAEVTTAAGEQVEAGQVLAVVTPPEEA